MRLVWKLKPRNFFCLDPSLAILADANIWTDTSTLGQSAESTETDWTDNILGQDIPAAQFGIDVIDAVGFLGRVGRELQFGQVPCFDPRFAIVTNSAIGQQLPFAGQLD